MPAEIIVYPSQPPRDGQSGPASGHVAAQVIPFPNPGNSLTRADLSALAAGDWHCETARDDDWNLWAIVTPAKPIAHVYLAYVVCRSEGRLLLRDGRVAARWQTLGRFKDATELSLVLSQLVAAAA